MDKRMLNNYREMRITLAEVPATLDGMPVSAHHVEWSARVKPLGDDWGTGDVIASGYVLREGSLSWPEDAALYLERALNDWLDRRQ